MLCNTKQETYFTPKIQEFLEVSNSLATPKSSCQSLEPSSWSGHVTLSALVLQGYCALQASSQNTILKLVIPY